jgi:hypothetical protein
MKNIAIILFVIYLGIAQAVDFCCTGIWNPNTSNYTLLKSTPCLPNANFRCVRENTSSSFQTLRCSDNSTGDDDAFACTDGDNCNCPPGFFTNSPDNDDDDNSNTPFDPIYGNMKSIMYPVMGVLFGLLWLILAFIGAALPLDLLLLIVGLIDAIFGIFLIFIPLTTFLGLFYMAVGAFTIAITRHAWGGDTGIDFLLALTIIIFLLTGGLTFVAFDAGRGDNYVNRMTGYAGLGNRAAPFWCDDDMNIDHNDGRSTRCHHYAYFVTFCVFLLFLVQPIGMIAAAFKRVGRHHDTTVVVNEKHTKPENKNTV